MNETNAGDPELDALLLDAGLEPPMVNGEIAFEAPWQGRVFGMARVLQEQGYYTWDEFRAHLIAKIGDWDRSAGADEADYFYYDHFLAALQALLEEKGMVAPGELQNRSSELAARPHGHDH